ncbi:hypothetical protein Aglo01_59090 [Actinokineospora globicatena]|nr:hypothetical protein Aglo01_59090 [Actinokineospora globicatena]GLW87874.1 hypothetical protein Aglo02_55130 [Actinokineospora globicatena]
MSALCACAAWVSRESSTTGAHPAFERSSLVIARTWPATDASTGGGAWVVVGLGGVVVGFTVVVVVVVTGGVEDVVVVVVGVGLTDETVVGVVVVAPAGGSAVAPSTRATSRSRDA